jgi:Bax protein
MKIITALILRTNEKIKAEKKRLIRLQEKFLWQMAWTPEEEAFFNMLVQKYDVFTKKKREGQLQELIEKVDIIPPSIAVVQAIWYTDWGQKNQKSIYGEYGWIKEEAYQPLEFESLADATDSFALQINSRSQLHQFHQIRRQYMFFAHRKSIGLDIIDMMAQFMDWDKQYVEKVGRTYGKGFILELDLAKFKNEDE